MPQDELLTTTQAGGLIGTSTRTVQRMIQKGELPFAQKLPGPNGAHLIRRRDVEALLAARMKPAA